MKQSKLNEKLKLNKTTVSKLNQEELIEVKGGATSGHTFTCDVPSKINECLKCPWPLPRW